LILQGFFNENVH